MSGGGTSVPGRPLWHWLTGLSLVGVLMLAVMVSGKDKSGDQDNDDSGGDNYAADDHDNPPPVSAAVSAPAPVEGGEIGFSLSDEMSDKELEAASKGNDVDALLATLAGNDLEFSFDARSRLVALGKKPEVIAVLWQMVRTGTPIKVQRAKGFLKEWDVPVIFDRTTSYDFAPSPGQPDWKEASLELDGDALVFEMQYWFGELLYDGPFPAYVEVSVRGGGDTKRLTFTPQTGENKMREIVATNLAPGTYEVWSLLWGHNRETKVQHNLSGPSLKVVVP